MANENAKQKRSLTESTLDVSTGGRDAGRKSDARLAETRRGLGNRTEGQLATASPSPPKTAIRPGIRMMARSGCGCVLRLRPRRRFGYRCLHILLAREGVRLSRNGLFRLYREERLGVRKRALGTLVQWLCRRGRTSAARWTSSSTHSPASGGSGCSRSWTISSARASVWSSTRRSPARGWSVSRTGSRVPSAAVIRSSSSATIACLREFNPRGTGLTSHAILRWQEKRGRAVALHRACPSAEDE